MLECVWVTESSAIICSNTNAHNKASSPPVQHYYADKWRSWAALGSCRRMMMLEDASHLCLPFTHTSPLFVELTIQSHCDKCMTPIWIMDHPKGQTLGQKAVRPRGPLCVTSLTPYKFTSSQIWQWAVLHNPTLRSQSSWYVSIWVKWCIKFENSWFDYFLTCMLSSESIKTSTCFFLKEEVWKSLEEISFWLNFLSLFVLFCVFSLSRH